MEYQNNDSEYFQKNDERDTSEYFINTAPNRTDKSNHDFKRIKRRLKSVVFILASSSIVFTMKRGMIKPVFAEPTINEQAISTSEIQEDSTDAIMEQTNEIPPEVPALYERNLSDEELQYLESIKQSLDNQDYEAAGNLITNNSIFQELISSCEWKEDKRIGFFINDKKAMENGCGNGMCLYLTGKTNPPTIYYGGIDDGYATGDGIMLKLDKYGRPIYYIGAWENGYPNGYGEDYGNWYSGAEKIFDCVSVLSGTFVDGYAEGTSTYTMTYLGDGERNASVETYTFVSHNRILEVTASIQPSTVEDDEYPYILVSTNGEKSFGVPEEELTSGHWITAMYHK